MRLKDKVALITGASGGLGKHFCKAFLKEGARVCVTDVAQDMVDAAVSELDSADAVMGAVVDVCSRSTIEAAVAGAVETFGSLDILVNVAGGALHTPHKFEEIELFFPHPVFSDVGLEKPGLILEVYK